MESMCIVAVLEGHVKPAGFFGGLVFHCKLWGELDVVSERDY